MHVYCINLERRPDRRAHAQKEFDREGLTDVEFFKATDGRVDAPEYIFVSKSEYGCNDSHFRIYRDIVQKGHPRALILEDDVHLAPNFKFKMEIAMQEADHFEWDLLYLGHNLPIKEEYLTSNIFAGKPLATHAYVITQEAARKICNFDTKFIRHSIDFELNRMPLARLGLVEKIAYQSPTGHLWDEFIHQFNGDLWSERTTDWEHFLFLFGDYVVIIGLLILVSRLGLPINPRTYVMMAFTLFRAVS
jgi:GR25 family glycosyltransferase involved in LPS biosynthesis